MDVEQCHICQTPGNTQQLEELKKLLPSGYSHLICTRDDDRVHLKVKLSTVGEVDKWLDEFQHSSTFTWRIEPIPSQGGTMHTECHHKTYGSGKTSKNTNYPATLFLVLKRSMEGRRSRSTDQHMAEGYLLYVNLRTDHNHRLSCADALSKRDVSALTSERLTESRGHSPASALDTLKYDLQVEEGERYCLAAADRSIVPDIQFCYRLYYKIFQRAYGAPSGEDMFADLTAWINQYNSNHGCVCAQMEQTMDGQLVVAICTPVMQRFHKRVHQSGELIFVDSSGNCDRQNHRLFLVMTHSAAGGLPLGVVITTSETATTISTGMGILKRLLPHGSFFGCEDGPQAIMTDDCPALRQALQSVFPTATLILCTFHLLQAMWRWLWNSHNQIKKEDRPQLLHGFQTLVYAKTEEDLSMAYAHLSASTVAAQYPRFSAHLADVYRRRSEWALCLRSHLMTRGNNTNNYVESAMRIVKDKVLHRLKAYNLTQLVDFITTRFEAYYIRRLTDFANNRVVRVLPKPPSCGDVDCQRIVRVNESNFQVPSASSNLWYSVNTALGCCSCPIGVTSAPCKHRSAAVLTFNLTEPSPLQSTPSLRKLFYEIACGTPEESSTVTAQEGLERQLDDIFGHLKQKLSEDKVSFSAVQSFVDSFGKLKTDSAVQSALFSFAKDSLQSTKVHMRPRGFLQTSTAIGVQPTAVARRKAPLGGRRTLGAGRPTKNSRRDHHYSRQGRVKGVPHNLSFCVQENTSLGKSH
ncbi:hypothetical protein N1851_030442 [Merluccius polli]|uniref:SWIM-type domain-containing protein n=1 Tax=Merluccius polli TaxID=89951 RepID=A0AA47M5J2_MERPO|nr:hypothetical protein N1851_030442 [Merluccius polli]